MRQDLDGIFISQRKYVTELLKRFNMLNCNPPQTFMNTKYKFVLNDGTGAANAFYYRSLVGGLNYLSHTRPDITFSISFISRFMCSPSMQQLGAAKTIFVTSGFTP